MEYSYCLSGLLFIQYASLSPTYNAEVYISDHSWNQISQSKWLYLQIPNLPVRSAL